jgi:uncharacterized protein YyaL (SSP411 family)
MRSENTEPQKAGWNHLKNETSPYLLQHADNPVDWYPWSEEAFEKAHREDKMVFLSIGYSTCHWCHVMEHESFEDEEVAALMNRSFVPIKVDREERPDLDSYFMDIAIMLNGNGGWPLNLVLTPERNPFFAATYIPKTGGMRSTGLIGLLSKLEQIWTTQRERIDESVNSILQAVEQGQGHKDTFQGGSPEEEQSKLISTAVNNGFQSLLQAYEPRFGGFSRAPKFPQPHTILFLLRYGVQKDNEEALSMAEHTLQQMRAGGIYDHLGFGFHRYSTDMEWKVPHFEKMLYDQAMTILAYVEAYRITGKKLYADTVDEIYTYLARDMLSSEGGFYSAVDADSEGVEGKFYLWDYDEFAQLLGEGEKEYIDFFHLYPQGNYTDQVHGHAPGDNILYRDPDDDPPGGNHTLESLRKRLLREREKRVPPHTDDKILTDWNSLVIFALARAGWVLNRTEYVEAAESAWGFLVSKMLHEDSSLFHSYRLGRAAVNGYLDDYAFLIAALLELYRARFKTEYLSQARQLSEYVLEHFEDKDYGGFFFTDKDSQELPVRKKKVMDNAYPAGNSLMLANLLTLFRLTGTVEYREKAENGIRALTPELSQAPAGCSMLLSAIMFYPAGGSEIVIVGEEEEVDEMIGVLNTSYRPDAVVLVKTPSSQQALTEIAPFTQGYQKVEDGKPSAYVCSGFACQKPVTTSEALRELLCQTG